MKETGNKKTYFINRKFRLFTTISPVQVFLFFLMSFSVCGKKSWKLACGNWGEKKTSFCMQAFAFSFP